MLVPGPFVPQEVECILSLACNVRTPQGEFRVSLVCLLIFAIACLVITANVEKTAPVTEWVVGRRLGGHE